MTSYVYPIFLIAMVCSFEISEWVEIGDLFGAGSQSFAWNMLKDQEKTRDHPTPVPTEVYITENDTMCIYVYT